MLAEPPPEMPELSERQFRFVLEYVADPTSAARAYQRAYNLPHTHQNSRNLASQLLKNVHIKAAIAFQRHEWCREKKVTFQSVVRKLASIAFADPADLYESDADNGGLPKPRPWDDIRPTARKNIKTIKFKRRKLKSETSEVYELEEFDYRVADQEWALGKLCEYLGVTKGSLTADELRAIVYGTAAATHGVPTPAIAAPVPAEPVPPGADAPAIAVHPAE